MSYKDGRHPMFQYDEKEKLEVRKELGLKEITIQEDVDGILEWFEKQPQLIDAGLPDRDFIEKMLINAKGSREKAKRRIDNYYKYRSLAPELVQDTEKLVDDVKKLWGFYRIATIPKLYDLKRIIVVDFTEADPNKFFMDVLLQNSLMAADIRLKYDYMLGDIWVLDLKLARISHLLRVNILTLHKAAQIFQEGMGIRIYAIHVLGAPSIAQQLTNFFKRFIKPKIMDRVIFHDTIESLHKSVPKKYLPKDYGGEEPSMEDFKQKFTKFLQSDDTKVYLKQRSTAISDESKRPDSILREEYLTGSFKKLEFD